MKILQEVTEWADGTPNHVYILNDAKDKMYAYVKSGTTTVNEVRNPYRFDTRGRKFKEIPNIYSYTRNEEKSEGFVKIVVGSKGEKYTITENAGVRQCTCAGFKFRGQCKHTAS